MPPGGGAPGAWRDSGSVSGPSSQPSGPIVPRTVLPPVPRWKVVAVVVGVGMVTVSVVIVLWWAGTRGLVGSELVQARFDALRIGLSIGVGGGGLFALYLAWRRQRSTEADLDNRERALAHQEQVAADTKTHLERVAAITEAHQERVATTTEDDARARRVTDLYTKAVDQLGSEKAPVRLGGLYALERLAQDNPDQRQTIVNVICAYLRMPYILPGLPLSDEAAEDLRTRFNERAQEREVRLTAQRILQGHLHPGPESERPLKTFWPDIDLDLNNARLINVRFDSCCIRNGEFDGAQFAGITRFYSVYFTGRATFDRARFEGVADFDDAQFTDAAWFDGTRFADDAWFADTRFTRHAGFHGAWFAGHARFRDALFTGQARFNGAQFAGDSRFDGARFAGSVWFEVVQFAGATSFDRAQFTDAAWFDGAQFNSDARFDGAQFARGTPAEVAHFVGASESGQGRSQS